MTGTEIVIDVLGQALDSARQQIQQAQQIIAAQQQRITELEAQLPKPAESA